MAKAKPQLFFIHGGMTFRSRRDYEAALRSRPVTIEPKVRWFKQYLPKVLCKQFDVIQPHFPLKDNAKYKDWAIHFERHLPLLRDGVVLVGFSLGGIFLARWLSENTFPKKLAAVCLVAAPHDASSVPEDLVGGFRVGADLSQIEKQCDNVHFFFSTDDKIVTLASAEKYRRKLPQAHFHILNHRGHFVTPTFPELIKVIKDSLK